ncbi:MAG: 2-phosphosulfolactate phosphatase [Clostridiales bacterium]|nr:2-phosphosulfolactate phosphatase [Clostridiales bacterium]
MEIQILQQIEGARKAEGLTVIIDVFRAFSLECYLAAAGAGRILPVGAKETAYALKEEHPDYLLVGERHGVILPGFDYGNSPSQTEGADIEGRTLVHTTSAGTQGIVNAVGAEEILTGSLVNARAIAEYIRKKGCGKVSLVCMGLEGVSEAPEDTLCGRYIKSILEGRELDMKAETEMLRCQPSAEKFFRPENQEVFPEKDYHMCVDTNRFDFVLRVERLGKDLFEVHRVNV